MIDETMLEWVRAAHAHSEWTTSVCTGSLVLAAAGILDGLEVTTHWMLLDALREYGATPVARRVVEQGKVITAAGVSAGIDMALTVAAHIAGAELAQGIQLGIEYDPQPPFNSGSAPHRAARDRRPGSAAGVSARVTQPRQHGRVIGQPSVGKRSARAPGCRGRGRGCGRAGRPPRS